MSPGEPSQLCHQHGIVPLTCHQDNPVNSDTSSELKFHQENPVSRVTSSELKCHQENPVSSKWNEMNQA